MSSSDFDFIRTPDFHLNVFSFHFDEGNERFDILLDHNDLQYNSMLIKQNNLIIFQTFKVQEEEEEEKEGGNQQKNTENSDIIKTKDNIVDLNKSEHFIFEFNISGEDCENVDFNNYVQLQKLKTINEENANEIFQSDDKHQVLYMEKTIFESKSKVKYHYLLLRRIFPPVDLYKPASSKDPQPDSFSYVQIAIRIKDKDFKSHPTIKDALRNCHATDIDSFFENEEEED